MPGAFKYRQFPAGWAPRSTKAGQAREAFVLQAARAGDMRQREVIKQDSQRRAAARAAVADSVASGKPVPASSSLELRCS